MYRIVSLLQFYSCSNFPCLQVRVRHRQAVPPRRVLAVLCSLLDGIRTGAGLQPEGHLTTHYATMLPFFQEGAKHLRVLGAKRASNPDKRGLANPVSFMNCISGVAQRSWQPVLHLRRTAGAGQAKTAEVCALRANFLLFARVQKKDWKRHKSTSCQPAT